MAQPNPDWKAFLRSIKIPDIDAQIAALKDRILMDQQEIVLLTVVRKGLQRSEELRRIADKRANEAIDEAIAEANGERLPLARFNNEGGIT